LEPKIRMHEHEQNNKETRYAIIGRKKMEWSCIYSLPVEEWS
jgi:hypothetical protein